MRARSIPARLRSRPRLRRPAPRPAARAAPRGSEGLIASLVGLAAALAFLPALQGDFVLWDDDRMFLENHFYRGLGWSQIMWMFTTFHMGHWMPLTWLSLGLDYLLWGMNPAGYRATNLLLHGANAAAVYLVSLRLLRRVLAHASAAREGAIRAGAAGAALFFALHPLRVESVAWATERRDVLCALFYLLAVLAYLRALDGWPSRPAPDRRWYAASLVLFALALLSKSMAVSLPVVLLILDAYPLSRLGGRPGGWLGPATRGVWLEKIPFALLSLAASVIAWLALADSGNASTVADVTAGGRAAISLYGLGFYLWKSVMPVGLSPLYERHGLAELLSWPVAVSAIVLATITGLAIGLRRRWPALPAVWASYGVILLPVLGIVPNGHQIAADRYTYLACLGWAILAGAGVARVLWLPPRTLPAFRAPLLLGGLGLAVLAALAGLTWEQTRVWRDSETLWTHALAIDPRSAVALNNLGAVRSGQGRGDEALALFQRAVEIRPGYAAAHFNWGYVLAARRRFTEAIERFQQALRLDPHYAAPHNDWGLALVRLGRPAEAIEHFREALRIRPAFATAHSNWGLALLAQGRRAEAVERFARALALNPDHAEAHYNWGYALADEGRIEEAIAHFRAVLRIKPDHAAAHNDWGLALVRQGRADEAMEHLSEALRVRPDFAVAHNNLGMALMHLGRPAEAIERFRQAVELDPDLALAHANWGLALLQRGQPAEAGERFARALQLEPSLAPELERARRNLAAVLGRGGAGPSPSAMMSGPQPGIGRPERGAR